MKQEWVPKEHFDVAADPDGQRLNVKDDGFEQRARDMLELAYRTAFLNQPFGEVMKSGMRSFFEKKWTAYGEAGVAKKVAQYAVGAASFAVLTALTGPGVVVLVGVAVGAAALKKGLSKGIDEAAGVGNELKRAGDRARAGAKSASQVLKVVLRKRGVTTVIERLMNHWGDVKLFQNVYGQKVYTIKEQKKTVFRREADALAHFRQMGAVDEWRKWDGGTRNENYLDAAGKLSDSSSQYASAGFFNTIKEGAKSLTNTVSGRTNRNFMRLKIKKLTFYNACLMDYCRSFKEEHDRVYQAVVEGWDNVSDLVRMQAHVTGSHHLCSDKRCFGGYALLQQVAEAEGCTALLEKMPPKAKKMKAGRLSAGFAKADDAVQQPSAMGKKIRKRFQSANMTDKQEKAARLAAAKGGKAAVVKGGRKVKQAIDGGGASASMGVAWPSMPTEVPNPATAITSALGPPVVPCLGQVASDLTEFFFSHYKGSMGAREKMAALTEGLQEADATLENGNRIVADAMESLDRQDAAFFIQRIPTADQMEHGFKAELVTAATKIEHYVLKGDRRRKQFLDLYEKISAREPAACASCEEAYELAYRFFNMLKTLWKLEQHLMFVQVYAKGIAAALEEQAGSYCFPAEAAGSLAAWFEFWHYVPEVSTASASSTSVSSHSTSLPGGDSTSPETSSVAEVDAEESGPSRSGGDGRDSEEEESAEASGEASREEASEEATPASVVDSGSSTDSDWSTSAGGEVEEDSEESSGY